MTKWKKIDLGIKIRDSIRNSFNSGDLKKDLQNYNEHKRKFKLLEENIINKIMLEAKNYNIKIDIKDIRNGTIKVKIINDNSTNQKFSKFLNILNKRGLEMINIYPNDEQNLILNLGVKE